MSGSSIMGGPFGIGDKVAAGSGGKDDPLGIFPVNQPGGANYIANHPPQGGPPTIPTLGGPQTGQTIPGINNPKLYNPNSFAPPSTLGGTFNAMAQQAAGPRYVPTLLHPQTQTVPQQSGKGGMMGMGLNNPMLRHPGPKFGPGAL